MICRLLATRCCSSWRSTAFSFSRSSFSFSAIRASVTSSTATRSLTSSPAAIGKLLGIYDQSPVFSNIAHEIYLIPIDISVPRRRHLQQRIELRHVPFAGSEFTERLGRNGGRVDPKCTAEGFAGRNQAEVSVQQEQRRGRMGDNRQCEVQSHIWMRKPLGSHGCPFLKDRRLAERKPCPDKILANNGTGPHWSP